MNRRFPLLALCLICLCACLRAQVEPTIIGRDMPEKCAMNTLLGHGTHICTVTNGKFGKRTISVGKVKAETPAYTMKLRDNETLYVCDNYLLVCAPYDLKCYRMQTGTELWHLDASLYRQPLWHNDSLLLMRRNNDLMAYRLQTGRPLWIASVDVGDGIDYMQESADGRCLYISCDDLYCLDLTTGESHKQDAKTMTVSGKRLAGNIGLTLAAAAAGVAMGSATGWVYIPIYSRNTTGLNGMMSAVMPSGNMLSRLCSQVLECDTLCYMADRKAVRCMDLRLNRVVWQTPLPEKCASESWLYMRGDTLVMMNHGTAYVGGTNPRACGRPFAAAFDARSGRPYFYRQLADKRERHAQNLVYGGLALSRTDQKIMAVSLQDSSVTTIVWDTLRYGALRLMAEEPHYRLNAETLRFDSLGLSLDCVFTTRGDAYRVPLQGEPELVLPRSTHYTRRGTVCDSLMVLVGGPDGTDCYVASPSGEPLYHFDSPLYLRRVTSHAIHFWTTGLKHYGIALF